MTVDPNRTYHASQAMQLSELIALKFSSMRFGKSPARIVRVAEPDGPSTDGGRKARQSMLLAPEKGEGHSIVFGFIDLVKKSAELRSYAALKQQYEARHHQPLDVTDEEYGKLLGTMRDYLNAQQIGFELVDPPAPRGASGPANANVRVRGASGIGSTVVDDDEESAFPVVPVAIGFIAGTLFGFILCYLLLV
jgi:hypothetical protein